MSATDSHHPESGRRADADRLIDIVRRYESKYSIRNVDAGAPPKTRDWNSKRHREDIRREFTSFNEPILPGFGELGDARTARVDCGDAHPFVCDSCGHAVEFGRTCAQSVCSRCGNVWVRDGAINKVAKLRRIKWEKYDTTGIDQYFHHVIFSFRARWYLDLAAAGHTLKEVQEITRQCVKELLDEMNAQGLLLRHSYRGERDDGSIKDESDDRGAWKERLFSGREWGDDVREELAWRPHYHAILVSDFVKGQQATKRLEEETGLIIHRIADDRGRSLADDGAMARATTYALSHTDIEVDPNGHNRAATWWVGSFDGDPIKSASRFSATDRDQEWAGAVVREHAAKTLGLANVSTDCGATIPPVDDPEEFARRVRVDLEQIYADLYPDDRGDDQLDTETILDHVAAGNIRVDTTSTAGGGGDVTVTDVFGEPVRRDRGGADLPTLPDVRTADTVDAVADADGHDHADADADQEADPDDCTGTLLPLEVVRRRGLLEDVEWLRTAAHADEAREADADAPDDLEPWRTDAPDGTPSVTGVG